MNYVIYYKWQKNERYNVVLYFMLISSILNAELPQPETYL